MSAADGILAGPIACVDLETTGGLPARDRVIEAGIVRIEDGVVVEEYSTLVRPGVRIPRAIQHFTGITDEMVADAPPFAAVADAIEARIAGALFVAHNARFDYGFLRQEFRRLGRRFRAPVLCTVRLSRALSPGERGHSLDAVMQRHGIACEARHRALGDARVLAEFLRLARTQADSGTLSAIVSRLTSEARLPPQLDPCVADELPEGPGVYLLYGENDVVLYVGKARNLANRVTAHFSKPHSKLDRELTRLVRRIEWIETAGEFGAQIVEARLIRAQRPALNREPRDSSESWVIRLRRDLDVPLAVIEPLDSVDDPGETYGLFRRERDAERALEGLMREHGLCAKRLGLESAEGSCVGYTLGRCRGACAGREPPALHAVRAKLALARLKRRDWPFAGRIGIRERNWRGVEEMHVFHRWCADGEPFDPGLYRILTGFLDRPVRGAELVTLPDP